MTVYVDIYTLQLYIIDLTQRGCHTLRSGSEFFDTFTNIFLLGIFPL